MTLEAAGGTWEQPASDRTWSIETNGINVVPDAERHGRPSELFWVWCAANISILAVVYGVIIVSFGLNLWQSILSGVVGTLLSFLLVGFVGVAGKRSGAPTFALSRSPFGLLGNVLPTITSYLSLVGWETVLVALATLAVDSLLDRLGVATGTHTTVTAFLVIAGVTIAVGLLGHATIVRIQTWFTWAFALLTVVFIALELPQVQWGKLADLPSGSWLTGFLPATSIVMAGLGISWANVGADYTRYLPRASSSRAVVGWTVLGSSVGPVVLITFGVLLASRGTGLSTSANPLGDLAEPLPTWFLVPYLLAAAGGLVAGALLDIYSSGLNLLTLGLRRPRYQSVAIDGAIMILGNIYILFIAEDFLGTFQGFLLVLGVPLAAWAAVFLVDMATLRRDGYDVRALYGGGAGEGLGERRGGAPMGRTTPVGQAVNPAGVVAWLLGVVAGLGLITSTTKGFTWLGWWAKGPFAGSSLGLLVAFVVAGLLYGLWAIPTARRTQARPAIARS
jgi:NCS1 family nucleobase:cation symporter-1